MDLILGYGSKWNNISESKLEKADHNFPSDIFWWLTWYSSYKLISFTIIIRIYTKWKNSLAPFSYFPYSSL